VHGGDIEDEGRPDRARALRLLARKSDWHAGMPRRFGRDPMTVLENVSALITRLSPSPICDDCVAEKLNLTVRQHANHKTRELAGTNGFERRRDICSICYGEKLVTRRN